MKKTIEEFELVLRPIDYSSRTGTELTIKIVVNGIVYSYRRLLHPEDMKSRYDQLFEIAKDELIKQVEKYDAS